MSKLGANPVVDYLTIDPSALEQIQKLIQGKDDSCAGVKVSMRTRGCSGMSYMIEYAVKDKNITKFDDLVVVDGVNIFIDAKASMFLIGSKMIYKKNDLEEGFDFINPNEKGRCGCGESVKL
jgi:iron-sulfur cluster assembly protein